MAGVTGGRGEQSAWECLSLVPLVTKDQHLAWANTIKEYLPHCVSVYNNLLQHGHGLVSHDTFYVLQGRPHSHIVLCKKEITPLKQNIGIFCLEDEVDTLIEVLRSEPLINWADVTSRNLILHHFPPFVLEPLKRLTKEKGVELGVLKCNIFTYTPHLDTHTLRVSAGLRVCRLGKAGIRHLLEKAKYGDLSLELLYRLAEGVPYLGVYRDASLTHDTTVDPLNLPVAGDEEIPVAWVCSGPSGDVAKLITEEGFRRRGLGRLLIRTVARWQAALVGFMPYAFVESGNGESWSMFSNTPGWSVTHEAFWIH